MYFHHKQHLACKYTSAWSKSDLHALLLATHAAFPLPVRHLVIVCLTQWHRFYAKTCRLCSFGSISVDFGDIFIAQAQKRLFSQ